LPREDVRATYNQLLSDGQIDFVTFHQSYSYEEFIEGIKAETTEGGNVAYHIRDGIFKKMCQVAAANPNENFVLIIDEINRGNISRIFGELITLIEDSKRIGNKEALQIRLAYSGSTDDAPLFGVPNNLYLIGTMNTADRSIALIDTALRRRFTFIEYPPKPELLPTKLEDAEIDLCQLLTTINQRIEFLLDKDHQIGHANWLEIKDKAGLCKVFKDSLLPLLEEYFYNDWEKIQMVLGDNKEWKSKDDLKLITQETKVLPKSVFGTEADSLEGKILYRIRPDLLAKNYEAIPTEVFTSIYQKQ
jgi:5-methylcytosine-specific restriction endonuclease McrBC GTP-binding regulatory subunit McrB